MNSTVFFVLVFGGPVLAILLWNSLYMVRQRTAVIIERLGRFHKVQFAGLHVKIPFIDRIAVRQQLRIMQLDVDVETKTLDNVFVNSKVSIQYHVRKEKVAESFYSLTDPEGQIESFVFDTVRSEIPKMRLDEVFSNKDAVAHSIRHSLEEAMLEFGYVIASSLVTDIQPDQSVKEAMNHINASERLKEAALNEAEAQKIRSVKAAEAEAESKQLQGRGLANQRMEIARGIRESIETIKETGVAEEEVMTLLLVTQHYDAIQDVARHSGTNTVMMNYSPSGIKDVSNQIREAVLSVKDHTHPLMS